MFNVCMCGSQAGYPHAADCPYPLFRGSVKQEDDWISERSAINGRNARLAELELQSVAVHEHWTVEEVI